MNLKLNGFSVDQRIETLMRRKDWPGRRTDYAWLNRFPPHPNRGKLPFVEFCSIDHAKFENSAMQQGRLLDLVKGGGAQQVLNGKPDADFPPGDFDPWHGYLIGFTEYCDSGIFVDLRPPEPRIIYDNLNPDGAIHATSFDSIDEFVVFYELVHGRSGEGG
ncbi:hypothetical protein [Aeoliella sp.]|uniref:hypothetical protein n=1 Tax=Aeoliella sp. TaxID=2795800 RepID=UPI003CCBA764